MNIKNSIIIVAMVLSMTTSVLAAETETSTQKSVSQSSVSQSINASQAISEAQKDINSLVSVSSAYASLMGKNIQNLTDMYTTINLEGSSNQLSMPKVDSLANNGNEWLKQALDSINVEGIDTSKFKIVDMPKDTEYMNAKYALLQKEFEMMGFGEEYTLDNASFSTFNGNAENVFGSTYGFTYDKLNLGQYNIPSGFGSNYKTYDIPDDFNVAKMLSDFSSQINSDYGTFMASDEYKTIRNNISTSNVSEQIALLTQKDNTLSMTEVASTLSSLQSATGTGFESLSTYYKNMQNWENGYETGLSTKYNSANSALQNDVVSKYEALKAGIASDSFINSVKVSMSGGTDSAYAKVVYQDAEAEQAAIDLYNEAEKYEEAQLADSKAMLDDNELAGEYNYISVEAAKTQKENAVANGATLTIDTSNMLAAVTAKSNAMAANNSSETSIHQQVSANQKEIEARNLLANNKDKNYCIVRDADGNILTDSDGNIVYLDRNSQANVIANKYTHAWGTSTDGDTDYTQFYLNDADAYKAAIDEYHYMTQD